MRYEYPDAPDALSAKIEFYKEHHYKIKHCFQNTGGKGYVLFDTNEDINEWYIEKYGRPYIKPVKIYTKEEAIKEIESRYGKYIDEVLANRDTTLPILAVGLPSSTAFGNSLFLKFSKSADEEDIAWRFYIHYNAFCFEVTPLDSNSEIREILLNTLYTHFKERYSRTK